jgi:hypothetical protein
MAKDLEMTAKFAVQEARVKYERAASAAANNRGNSPDAKRDQAAAVKAKAELDAAIVAADNAAKAAVVSKPVSVLPSAPSARVATATGTATAIPATPSVVVEEAPVDVTFANLTPEEQTAIGAINERAAVPTEVLDEDTDVNEVIGTTTYTAPDGKIFTNIDLYNAYLGKLKLDEKRERGESAYKLLYEEFDRYGLASLVTDVEEFIKDGLSKAELTLKLRGTTSYQKRFKANDERIKNGLAAISEAEYLALEDQYQNIMRNYGLPASYYTKGDLGVQEGFQKFIANDVSATELEDRIMTAQQRVINSNPEVLASLKAFYPDINNGDILAYTLDPKNALDNIKRKVTAAEIGGAATQAGLKTGMTRAEELGAAGITKAQAQQGFETVAGGAPRGGQLASMYGENPYTQTTAEQEVFGLAGKTEAATQRKKLTGLEKATFGGQSGATSTALVRDRAGAY